MQSSSIRPDIRERVYNGMHVSSQDIYIDLGKASHHMLCNCYDLEGIQTDRSLHRHTKRRHSAGATESPMQLQSLLHSRFTLIIMPIQYTIAHMAINCDINSCVIWHCHPAILFHRGAGAIYAQLFPSPKRRAISSYPPIRTVSSRTLHISLLPSAQLHALQNSTPPSWHDNTSSA